MTFAEMTNHDTGEARWMCPSHVALSYREATTIAAPNDILPSTSRSRAIHEAGHVVVARWFGFPVASVRIVPDQDDCHPGAARVKWGEPPSEPVARREWAERIARVCYAGTAATSLFYDGPRYDQDAVDDFGLAAFTLTRHVEACRRRIRRNRLLDDAKEAATRLLATLQEPCVKLAMLIETAGRLTEAEIVSLVDPLLPARERAE